MFPSALTRRVAAANSSLNVRPELQKRLRHSVVFPNKSFYCPAITRDAFRQRMLERGQCSRHTPCEEPQLAQSSPQTAVRNRLLAALPHDVLAQLLPNLRPTSLPVRRLLATPSEPIEAVYFVESGWVSMVTHLDDGMQAEVGLIGREGMVGLPLVVGVNTPFAETYVQADAETLQMEAKAFQRELDKHPALFRLLLRYNEALHAQSMQLAACNGRHNLEQRLARSILMALDRGEGNELPLTQEFLALMLCVQRPSITVVARVLQQAGLIRYAQGKVTVLDREGLEASVCDCYRAVQDRFVQLLG